MIASDILFLLGTVALSVGVTCIAFFVLKTLKFRSMPLRLLSAASFSALVIASAIYGTSRGSDPHGIVMVLNGLIALVTLPITILTTSFLMRRFP